MRFVAICVFLFNVSFPGEAGDPYITPDSMVLGPKLVFEKKNIYPAWMSQEVSKWLVNLL